MPLSLKQNPADKLLALHGIERLLRTANFAYVELFQLLPKNRYVSKIDLAGMAWLDSARGYVKG